MELLRIDNLTVGHERQPVVEHIGLTIGDRDYIGIIGPNGGGKTTFVKTLTGTLPPLGGKIERLVPDLRIGYLPQVKSVDRTFPVTVPDVILSGFMSQKGWLGRYKASDRQKSSQIMEETGIGHLADRIISDLSGGELQRVLLCRALVSEPQLLILDEPTTFVDHKFEKELYELLAALNDKMAIVMVSHDLGTITRHVKSIVCINRCFHYHPSNRITADQLAQYDCPIQLISHGQVPHTVLEQHNGCGCAENQ